MPQDRSFENAVMLEWDKRKRKALQPAADLLKSVFSRKALMEKQSSVDISGRLATTDLTSTPTTEAGIRPDTPDGVQLTWSRRLSKAQYKHIKIDVNRITAKYLGMDIDTLAARSIDAYIAARSRDFTTMMLTALTDTYVENPVVVSGQTPANVAFPVNKNYIPRVKTEGSNKVAPLDIKSFFEICAIHDDAVGINPYGQGKMDGSLDSITRVAIFSNRGWADFHATNAAIIGNKDYFGKSVYIDGYGMFMDLHGTLVVVLNTELLPAYATGGTDFGFDDAAAEASYLTAARAHGTTGDFEPDGLHTMFLVYPDAMDVMEPVQFNEPPLTYREQIKSLERAIYGVASLECNRIFEAPVSRILFGGDFTALSTQ